MEFLSTILNYRFQEVMETMSEIRIVVVAPCEENPRLIDRYRVEFPRVVIGTESSDEQVWNTLSGVAHDHFIYDRYEITYSTKFSSMLIMGNFSVMKS